MQSLCWHVVTRELVWHASNGLLHFGHLSPRLSCVRQGIRLALRPLAPRVAEGVHRPQHSPLPHTWCDTPKES